MKTTEELSRAQIFLHEEITKVANENGCIKKDLKPIYDGIADFTAYIESSPKVMWILKEPYDYLDEKGNPCGGGYVLFEDLKSLPNTPLDIKLPRTLQRIIYATRGFFSNDEYDDMGWYDEAEMYKYLLQIAYVNISKMPAYSSSGNMASKYQIWKPIILKQIQVYNPDILVFGHTFEYMRNDLEIKEENLIHSERGWVDIYQKREKLYVDTYHPGIRGYERQYVNSLIDSVRKSIIKK